MKKELTKNEKWSPERLLPSFFQLFLSLATVYLLFFEFTPALREYRDSSKALHAQEVKRQAAQQDLAKQRAAYIALRLDPQAIEAALDELGVLPPGHPMRRKQAQEK